MKTVGLITEYNPFHNGHKYHIEEAKRITGADTVIVVMSGDFVQRGTPAIMDKFLRARTACLSGADLVFELPTCYATASAEYFAEGAVALLDKLGVADSICFGSECGDISVLSDITGILIGEPEHFKSALQNNLKLGYNFAKARSVAFEECYPAYADIIKSPNNILGIEYIKALRKLNSNIKPFTITRKGNNYHDEYCDTSKSLSSATAIRNLFNAENSSAFTDFVPDSAVKVYNEALNRYFPINEDDFSSVLYYKLLSCINDAPSLSSYFEINEELSNRIINLAGEYKGFSEFAMLLKNKSLTHAKICRGLLHVILDIKSADIEAYRQNGSVFYARLLAMNNTQSNKELLKSISANSSLTLITALKKSLSDSNMGTLAENMLNTDIFADNLYQHISAIKYGLSPVSEFARNIFIS